MGVIAKDKQQKERNKLDYIELKIFCTANETAKGVKRQPAKWGTILAHCGQ